MNGYTICCIVVICITLSHIVDKILEQRRRETKTGEFSEKEDEE